MYSDTVQADIIGLGLDLRAQDFLRNPRASFAALWQSMTSSLAKFKSYKEALPQLRKNLIALNVFATEHPDAVVRARSAREYRTALNGYVDCVNQSNSIVGKFQDGVAKLRDLAAQLGITPPAAPGVGIASEVVVGAVIVLVAGTTAAVIAFTNAHNKTQKTIQDAIAYAKEHNLTPEQLAVLLDRIVKAGGALEVKMPDVSGLTVPIAIIIGIVLAGPRLIDAAFQRRS